MESSPNIPPPPSCQALHLVSALSNPEPADVHIQALKARDDALSASPASYGELCRQLAFCLAGCDNPNFMLSRVNPAELEAWKQQDPITVSKLQQTPSLWIPFGQMAGLVLKNALIRPPIAADGRYMALEEGPFAEQVQQTMLFALGCQNTALRAVASSVIAVTSVSLQNIQPALHIRQWPQLVPTLIAQLGASQDGTPLQEGALDTLQKMMEDGPSQFDQEELDNLVPALMRFLDPTSNSHENAKVHALQTLNTCVALPYMPGALIVHFDQYLGLLSALASDPSILVRQWVCRNIVTLVDMRTEYLQNHVEPIARFMLQCSADAAHPALALDGTEFWLTLASVSEPAMTPAILEPVQTILPQLIPVLLRNMVYQEDQRVEILARNEADAMEAGNNNNNQAMKPIFHRSRQNNNNQTLQSASDEEDDGGDDDGYEQDSEGGFDDDDDGNEWTLRKCSAASLDALANLYGAGPVLPSLLPELEKGLASTDPWIQEAAILALGAIAEGCSEEMGQHMMQLHPYLLNHLNTVHMPNALPQVACIAAWTIGRYAQWAVEQVQNGTQGHLLAQMTEVFLATLPSKNRRVQVAVCSAFGRVVEAAEDLMVPYLDHIYRALVGALGMYQGRSLVLLFDLFGTMADSCGPAIAEGDLPSIYVPPILHVWNVLATEDPAHRTLLPLMESLASIAMISGMNFQPYALECFDNAMAIIEAVQLMLATTGEKIENEEDADPIVCATDLLDGIVEGTAENFHALLGSSQRFGQQFLNVLHGLCQHETAGVRMSALALVGDLARNAPSVLEPALSEIIQQAVGNMDPVQPQVCTNAVWALGEICVRCQGNPKPLEPFASQLMQNLVALLCGNGMGNGNRGSDIPGLAENAAACAGRLGKVNPAFVANDLSRFLMGWCDGLAKIEDPTERRDGFQGFIKVLYANPQAIQSAAANASDAVASILFAIITWHIPEHVHSASILTGEYAFHPFPPREAELGASIRGMIHDMKTFVGEETWQSVQNGLPVNVRRLLRENYS